MEYKAVINIDGFDIKLAKHKGKPFVLNIDGSNIELALVNLEGDPTVDNIEDMLDSWLDAVEDLEDRL